MSKEFKPCLIPNFKKGDDDLLFEIIEKNGGIENYILLPKKDGCRLELKEGMVLTRSMKEPKSVLVRNRFKRLAEICNEVGIILEGEFYSHGMSFNEIYRFFSNTDVTSEEEFKKLSKMYRQTYMGTVDDNDIYVLRDTFEEAQEFVSLGGQTRLTREFGNRGLEWLTTFHGDLRFYWFDCFIPDEPDLPFLSRICEAAARLHPYFNEIESLGSFVLPDWFQVETIDELKEAYQDVLSEGYEGLVLVHEGHVYKFGRGTLKEGMILKMKDDKNVYDGIILDVEEGTKIKEGVERGKNELGYSTTSKYKEDREPSGMAKGFVVDYEGHKFTVSLKGFDSDAKVELLENKNNYIGRHFKYTGMAPLKDVPRHAFFQSWRDEK